MILRVENKYFLFIVIDLFKNYIKRIFYIITNDKY